MRIPGLPSLQTNRVPLLKEREVPPTPRRRTARRATAVPATPPPRFNKGKLEWIDLDELDSGIEGRAFKRGSNGVILMMSCGDVYDISISDLEKFVATVKEMEPSDPDLLESLRK